MEFAKRNIDFIVVLFISVVAYFLIFGFSSIDFNNQELVLRDIVSDTNLHVIQSQGADVTQHHLGSVLYRLDDFSPKIFLNHNIGYPYGVSVLCSDSIPIFALLFKILTKIFNVSPYIQYIGLWNFLCFILQGIFSVLILRELKLDKLSTIIASVFMVLSPVMVIRAFKHSALASHFLILMAIYLYIKDLNVIKRAFCWFLNFLLVLTIHPYFLPMSFAIFCGDYAKRIFITKEVKLSKFIIFALSLFVIFAIFLYGTGILSLEPSMKDWGYGFYSANLNALFNPMTREKISSLTMRLAYATRGQYEGCAYLGLGIIILLILSLYKVKNIKEKFNFNENWPIYIAVIGLFLFSVSNVVCFGHIMLFKYRLPNFIGNLFENFRSSGRMMWPIWYTIYLYIVFVLLNTCKKKNFKIILLLALLIQIVDLHPLFEKKKFATNYFINTPYKYNEVLQNDNWHNGEYAKRYESISFIDSPKYCFEPEMNKLFGYFWLWVSINHKKTNGGYLVRMPKAILFDVKEDLEKIKNNIIPDNKKLYVIFPSAYQDILESSKTNPKSVEVLKRLKNENDKFYTLTP